MSERGAAYIRVSTEEQAEFSPDAQLHAIRKYAEGNGILISDSNIFYDIGVSGRRADKRPGFMRMIATAKTKPRPFDIIIVHKYDRFARNREDSIVYKSLLRKECKIKVVSVTERMEDDKFSVILESMLEAMAEYYSLNLGEEVKKGMTEKARRGELQTPAPFGYRMSEGTLRIHSEEAEIIKYIFSAYTEENIGLKKIAREINERGLTTIRGNPFEKRAIEYIIRNPVYTGKLRWTPDAHAANRHDYKSPNVMVTDGKHEGIIDTALWERANEKLRQNKPDPRTRTPGNYETEVTTHWLRGVVKCSECGSVLSYGKGFGGRESAYRCNKYLNGGCKFSQRIVVSKLERIIIDTAESDFIDAFPRPYIKAKESGSCSQGKINDIKKSIEKNEAKAERARKLALSGIDTPEEYRKNKAELLAERLTLDKILNDANEDSKKKENSSKKISNIKDIFLSPGFSMTEKNIIIREIIKEIIYNRIEERIEIHYRDNPDINSRPAEVITRDTVNRIV